MAVSIDSLNTIINDVVANISDQGLWNTTGSTATYTADFGSDPPSQRPEAATDSSISSKDARLISLKRSGGTSYSVPSGHREQVLADLQEFLAAKGAMPTAGSNQYITARSYAYFLDCVYTFVVSSLRTVSRSYGGSDTLAFQSSPQLYYQYCGTDQAVASISTPLPTSLSTKPQTISDAEITSLLNNIVNVLSSNLGAGSAVTFTLSSSCSSSSCSSSCSSSSFFIAYMDIN